MSDEIKLALACFVLGVTLTVYFGVCCGVCWMDRDELRTLSTLLRPECPSVRRPFLLCTVAQLLVCSSLSRLNPRATRRATREERERASPGAPRKILCSWPAAAAVRPNALADAAPLGSPRAWTPSVRIVHSWAGASGIAAHYSSAPARATYTMRSRNMLRLR